MRTEFRIVFAAEAIRKANLCVHSHRYVNRQEPFECRDCDAVRCTAVATAQGELELTWVDDVITLARTFTGHYTGPLGREAMIYLMSRVMGDPDPRNFRAISAQEISVGPLAKYHNFAI